MPGIRMVTDLDRNSAFKTAKAVARDLGFAVREGKDWEFFAEQGSFPLSFLLGPLITPCAFRIFLDLGPKDTVEVILERNSAWWTTGIMGASRVKNQAQQLAAEIKKGLEAQGGRILKRTEF